jgi:hypothetical protein
MMLCRLAESGDSFDDSVNPITFLREHVCNIEISRLGKHVAYVVDTYGGRGSWLKYAPVTIEKPPGRGRDIKLPHPRKSVNYYPDLSPDEKYMLYMHAESGKQKSWKLKSGMDLYVTRFPEGQVAVRVTFTNAGVWNLQWWGPPDGESAAPAP